MATRGTTIDLLEEYVLLLDLLDEESFRARAFANAARQLTLSTATLDELLIGNRLKMVKGVGPAVEQAIRAIAEEGTFAELEQVRDRVPAGVLDLMRVDGLGPKKARTLWRDAKITSLDELEAAILAGSLTKLSGFGGKTLDKFSASLAFLRTIGKRRLRHHAKSVAAELTDQLTAIPGVLSVTFCGSLRRNCETIGDLDCLVCASTDALAGVKEQIAALDSVAWLSCETPIWSGQVKSGMDVELSVCTPDELGTKLVLATGSKPHVADLLARQNPLPLCATEEELYASLGLRVVPPPLREEGVRLRTLEESDYPRSVEREDLRGILHVHSTYSDGRHTIRQMAEAMMLRGYEFLGIADHSRSAAYAGGLTPDRVLEQWEEIDYLNDELAPFRILKGTECDILPDGSLDFEDGLLRGFDFVVASIHQGFHMSRDEATSRLCRALENPHVDILGHSTGRLLLKREGYPVDHERLLVCAADNGKSIELNSSPHRLDLDWRWFARALELGIPIPLNPDAHSMDGLDEVEYGLELAAKGPIPKELCPSAWSADEFLTWCQSHPNR
ncbi:MAG: DNA polymerase/3'-5' exonuclease PolX [Calditrichaeota bacterium]|nr:DNA polymerase/3'-5' exonuclease PolX [Calditrichota bacterium]MCB9391497.1 DNA polymerase/3'-5' exonuclease PolX [Calditrichota bacterium]